MAQEGSAPFFSTWNSSRGVPTTSLFYSLDADTSEQTVWAAWWFQAGEIAANLTASIGDITLAATAVVPINASVTASIGTITLAATAIVPINASVTASIGDITLAATAVVPINATFDTSIGSVVLVGSATTGTTTVNASMTASIGEVTLFTGAKIIPLRPTRVTTISRQYLAYVNGRYVDRMR